MSLNATLSRDGNIALITLNGELDALTVPVLRDELRRAAEHDVDYLVLDVTNVSYLSSAGLRVLAYARQKLPGGVRIVLVGANDVVQRTVRLVGFQYNLEFSDQFPGRFSGRFSHCDIAPEPDRPPPTPVI
jgi:anti-anti-sigma factor